MNQNFTSLASGVEIDAAPTNVASDGLPLPGKPCRLIQGILHDVTDAHSELMQQREWLLHPSERELRLSGNAFAVENVLDGHGIALLKLAPLPHARSGAPRSMAEDWDVFYNGGSHLELSDSASGEWAMIPYEGGALGRIAAVQNFQQQQRPYHAERDGLLLSNTWGDRSRDAHLSEEFMSREIEAAARLGVDIVQIDDGWQQGVTQNSFNAAQQGGETSGSWNGFWDANPNFWSVNRQRFPNGLQPLVQQARARGLQFGLWFAPDTSHGGKYWQRDAEVLLRLHREEGINFFKVDALKIESKLGEERLRQCFNQVLRESNHAVTFDFDITAEKRFGPFGFIETGPLFVENRYTDWGNYWPHHTLRVLWQLSHWIHPVRMRLEWLNHARNTQHYQSDPLAPYCWRPDALFATVMFASPLGWFEVQNLPDSYFEQAAPLISTWKEHRSQIHDAPVLPIGSAPDGVSWTGLLSYNSDARYGYALVFRELNPADKWQCELLMLQGKNARCSVLGGEGQVTIEDGVLQVHIPETLGFVWLRFELES